MKIYTTNLIFMSNCFVIDQRLKYRRDELLALQAVSLSLASDQEGDSAMSEK